MLVDPSQRKTQSPLTVPNLPIAEKRPRLLVVDDQPINIQTLFEIFDADCDVFMATSGKQALAFAVSEPPRPDLAGCGDARNGWTRGVPPT